MVIKKRLDGSELHNQETPKKTRLQNYILKIHVIKPDEIIEIFSKEYFQRTRKILK